MGGANGDPFNLAVARTTEIWVGIVCAGFVLATTDFGGTRRRLATLLIGLTAETSGGLMQALRVAGPAQALSRPVRRQLFVRVSGLDVVIDQAAGEIATLPFRPRALQAATEGLVIGLVAWRSVADHMESAPQARAEANQVMHCLAPLLPVLERADDPALWAADPGAMRATLLSAARLLVAIRTEEPSLRLLADRMAEGLLGLSRAITGVLVLEDPRLALVARRVARLRVPDVLPALMNAVRAFVAIGVASLVWIWLAWPGGATFITFTVIGVTMFAPREDEAYAAARSFTVGISLPAVCAGVIGFALLPQISSFAGFCAALGLVLVPAGALSTRPWQQPVFSRWEPCSPRCWRRQTR